MKLKHHNSKDIVAESSVYLKYTLARHGNEKIVKFTDHLRFRKLTTLILIIFINNGH